MTRVRPHGSGRVDGHDVGGVDERSGSDYQLYTTRFRCPVVTNTKLPLDGQKRVDEARS